MAPHLTTSNKKNALVIVGLSLRGFCRCRKITTFVSRIKYKLHNMRNLLFGFVAIVALALSACEPINNPEPADTKLELTSNEKLRVNCDGGDYEICYTLTNPVEGTAVKATVVNSAMITAADTSVAGVVKVTISENTTEEVREGAVIVSYGALSFTVVVEQEGATGEKPAERVDIAANQLVGNYYGDNLKEGVGHYWIILTKDGFVDGAAVAGGEYFRLDLIAPMPTDMDNVKIPDGEYRFDPYMSYGEYTIIDIGNTDYSWVDESMEGWAMPLADAKLTVNGNRFVLKALVDNTEYHVTFEGDYSLSAYVITDYVSSLQKDTVIDVSNCSAYVSSYGDYWDCGCNNWSIEFLCNDGMTKGTYVVIDFLSNSTTDFTGRYVDSGFTAEDETKPDFRAGTFVPGFRVSTDSDLLLGSLFMVYKDGLCVSQAPLYQGAIDIKANGDGTYTIVIDVLDDAPNQNRITLTWTGYFA